MSNINFASIYGPMERHRSSGWTRMVNTSDTREGSENWGVDEIVTCVKKLKMNLFSQLSK
jgi:hypothetical protein